MRLGLGAAAIAAVGGPAGVYLAGFPAWALGLGIGEALGVGNFLWIRRVVRQLFHPGGTPSPKPTLLWHSALRLGLTAAVLMAVIKTPAIQIWGVVLGYTLVQVPALLWQVRILSRDVRGVQ